MCNNKQDFVHLHCHTHYSIQDALPQPKKLVQKAKEMGFSAVAITDHGRMGGVVEFVDACKAQDDNLPAIKPIIGMEAYIVRDMTVKTNVRELADGTEIVGRPKHNHLTMWAENNVGYRNLCNIASIGAKYGKYYDPRVDRSVLEAHSEGVLVGTGCLGSEVSQYLLAGRIDKAEETMRWYKDVYGDRYYAEMQFHGIPEQRQILPPLVALAKKLDIPIIVSNDTHYLDKEDWYIHDIQIQMRNLNADKKPGSTKNGKKEAYASHQFYLKNTEEMMAIFSGKPEALKNTLLLAERVDVNALPLDVPHLLPKTNIPDNPDFLKFWHTYLPYNAKNEAYLAYLSRAGLKSLGLDKNPEYTARLKHELQIIWNMNVVDYFLIQNDMVKFMQDSNIICGVRGSGVGSLVLYALGVSTTADPLRWDLMFERFLNPGRGEQYKVDYSCYPYKQWVADNGKLDQSSAALRLKNLAKEKELDPQYLQFGPIIQKELWVLENQGFAAYVCDLADKGLKSADNESNLWFAYFLGITDKKPDGGLIVRKVATLPDVDTDIASDKRPIVIEEARRRFGDDHVSMIATYNTYQARAAVKGALKVSEKFLKDWGDNAHNKSEEITKTIPMRQQPPMTIEDAIGLSPEFHNWYVRYPQEIENAKRLIGVISNLGVHAAGVVVASEPIHNHAPIEDSNGVLVSSYDMKSVERVGLVKYDYLGLNTYYMIALALEYIKKRHGVTIDLAKDIDLNDKKVLKLYSDGKTSSLFQFASPGMQKSLKSVRVDRVDDLIAVNALFRPGPMANIDVYADGKHNPGKVKYPSPTIKEVLGKTYGVSVYQEQAMFLGREIAGFDWDETDKLRKSVSKKDTALFDKVCSLFRDKALAKNVSKDVVDGALEGLKGFGGYAFNKSHSAGYSILSYWTAYLRCYYPHEWLAACIHSEIDDLDKLAIYKRECMSERPPIHVEDPNVNESTFETYVSEDGRILLPLNSIKNVGKLAQCIIDNQPFEDLKDFCYRARPNIGTVKALAETSAFNCFPEMRYKSFEDIIRIYTELTEQRIFEEKAAAKAEKEKFTTVELFSSGLTSYIRPQKREKRVATRVNRINTNNLFNEGPL